MEKITNFIIDKSDLTTIASSRRYTIVGETDVEFLLQVFNSAHQFYNFKTKLFNDETSTIEGNNLRVKMSSNTYNGTIDFPTNGSGDTYTILLLALPNKNTELSFSSGKNSYSTTITQLANVILTFTPRSDGITSVDDYYESQPTKTSTASPVSTLSITETISWDLVNKEDDDYGYGLRLTRQPLDTDWYVEATENNVGGTAADSDRVAVASLTDIVVGMELTYITGTTAPGAATTIIDIDVNEDNSGTLILSRDQAITNGHTMTFRAYGSNIINDAIGASVDFSNWNSDVDTITLSKQFKKRVRAIPHSGGGAAAWKVIGLDNTYGIAGGNHVKFKGLNVNNNGTNRIVSVNGDYDGNNNDGTITVELAQTAALSVGTVLKFFGGGLGKGSRDQLEANNKVIINSYPSSNRTIYLDLDNFITIGRAS